MDTTFRASAARKTTLIAAVLLTVELGWFLQEIEMKFLIHGEDAAGNEDSLVIEGDTIEELKVIAAQETEKRGWIDFWSEELGD